MNIFLIDRPIDSFLVLSKDKGIYKMSERVNNVHLKFQEPKTSLNCLLAQWSKNQTFHLEFICAETIRQVIY